MSFFKRYAVVLVLFLIGAWTGPVFYHTIIAGSFIPTFQVPGFLQQICFGLVLGLAGLLVIQLYKANRQVEMQKTGLFLFFFVLILAGAFAGKTVIPGYATAYSGATGSGYSIDFRLFNKAVIVLTICMVLFVMVGYAGARKVVKLKYRRQG